MLNITQKEFDQLSRYIHENYGIRLGPEKMTLVTGRLSNTLIQKGFSTFSDYFKYVTSDTTGDAIVELLNKITTNHTFFLREPEHFKFFAANVLPWMEQISKDRDLRIWSAGCSSGEEPYTLAMLINDYFGQNKKMWNTAVLATDISSNVLNKAKTGIYSAESVAQLSDSWKREYFTKLSTGQYQIVDGIRNDVIYRKFNLMSPTFPFKRKFHVIFCRNVMIYFDTETRNNVISKYYDNLESGGYLFIGHSESVGKPDSPFKLVQPSIYRKET